VSSYETAEAISQRIGSETVTTVSHQDGDNSSHGHTNSNGGGQASSNYGRSRSSTTSEIQRKLLFPDEILTLPRDLCLVFRENMHALPVKLLPYYAAPEFRRGGVGKARGLGMAASLAAMLLTAGTVALAGAASSLSMPDLPQLAMRLKSSVPLPRPYSPYDGLPTGMRPLRYDRHPGSPAFGGPYNLNNRNGLMEGWR
jgi:hypothetical protein